MSITIENGVPVPVVRVTNSSPMYPLAEMEVNQSFREDVKRKAHVSFAIRRFHDSLIKAANPSQKLSKEDLKTAREEGKADGTLPSFTVRVVTEKNEDGDDEKFVRCWRIS